VKHAIHSTLHITVRVQEVHAKHMIHSTLRTAVSVW
jgi:hypothetical protein